MPGLAILFIAAGWILVTDGFNGDGSPGTAKTYSLKNAFVNALAGTYHPVQDVAAA